MTGTDTWATVDRAAELLRRGQTGPAAGLLAPVLGREPDNVEAWILMARVRLVLEDAAGALDAAGTALILAPHHAEALAVTSMALSELGRHPEAQAAAHRAVASEPDNPFWHDRVAWSLLTADTDTRQAERAAETAVRLDPGFAHFHVTHGVALEALGRRKQAREALLTALRLEPDNAAAHHQLATLQLNGRNVFATGELAGSAETFADALRIDPAQQESRLMLDVALRTFLVRTSYSLLLLVVVAARLHRMDLAPARAVVALGLLGLGWYAARYVGALSPTLRRYLWSVVTTGRQRTAAVGAALCTVVLLAVVAGPAAWAWPALGVAAVGALLVRVTTVSETNDHVRSAGIAVPYVLGTAVLVIIIVASGLLAALALVAGLSDGGSPPLVVAAGAGAIAGYTGFVLRRRRR